MNLLSVRAAARFLHIDHKTLQRAIAGGTCPAVRLGRRWKIEESALRRWASGGTAPQEVVIHVTGSASPQGRSSEVARG